MAKAMKGIWACGLFVLIVSCATTATMETNKDPSFSGPVTKLYVIVDVGDWQYGVDKLRDDVATGLQKALPQNGIDTKVNQVTGIELDPDGFKREMNDFGTTIVMLVKLVDGTVDREKEVAHGVFDISIQNLSSNYTLWRAKIILDGGSLYNGQAIAMDPAKLIESIVAALQKDGLITVAPAKSS